MKYKVGDVLFFPTYNAKGVVEWNESYFMLWVRLIDRPPSHRQDGSLFDFTTSIGWCDHIQILGNIEKNPELVEAMKAKYTLTCDWCGSIFDSEEGFPNPQYCPRCFTLFEDGMKEAINRLLLDMTITPKEGHNKLKEWGIE